MRHCGKAAAAAAALVVCPRRLLLPLHAGLCTSYNVNLGFQFFVAGTVSSIICGIDIGICSIYSVCSSSPPSPAHGSESATPQATETSTEGAAAATRAAQHQQQQQQQPQQTQQGQHYSLHPPLELQHLAVEGQASPASEPLSVPPYKPIVTPPPDQDAQLAKMGYSMTTFYTCDTVGGQEHCGWHVPVLKADAPTRKTDVRVVLAVVSCLAGILAWGLV
ncbi:hypothetical protein MKX07_002478 [Trichoderma sp. CBMAI-0711]|nr:hypothetical protein MKX07_002478 [Trichoderma sp. CBMAI-0711]